jgi:hypothetical protein
VGRISLFQCPRCACGRKAEREMSSSRRKPEDSAGGCRAFAASDRERASATNNNHVRETFERSAEAWSVRASLLERLQASFDARLEALRSRRSDQRGPCNG